MPRHPLFTGALFIVSAELMFAFMGASIRQVSIDLNNGTVVFARNLVGLALLSTLTLSATRTKLVGCSVSSVTLSRPTGVTPCKMTAL